MTARSAWTSPAAWLLGATFLAVSGLAARAAPTGCPQHFAGGQAPDLLNPRLGTGVQPLCYRAFAVLHSAVTRGPLYSAEHITRDSLAGARAIPRQGEFHAEDQLPEQERAELSDYARSGFDRGHMAPSGDMPDQESQQESFTLANMVPQVGDANRGLWEGAESAVRTLAERQGELYVVTGPVFQGARVQQLRGRVLVPTYTFKAVLDPSRGEAAAYVMQNATNPRWRTVSIQQLGQMTGMDVFPSLPASAKAAVMPLPAPTPHDARYRRGSGGGGGRTRQSRDPFE